ncbi:MAG: sugar transferase [Candidatus Latescibacterota bacterium]
MAADNNIIHLKDEVIPISGNSKTNYSQAINGLESVFRLEFPFWKRAIDIVGALVGLTILSLIFLAVAIIIKIVSPGPVFFKQKRNGQSGNYFHMYKFRTMKVNTDTSVHREYIKDLINGSGNKSMKKIDSDLPLIPFGSILRKTYLDELPQLINVLIGDMSLVGPRPCIPYESQEYLRWHVRRFDAKPGMTGYWQVSGKNKTSFIDMVRLDIYYVRHCSIILDLMILLKTPLMIIGQLFGEEKAGEEMAVEMAEYGNGENDVPVPPIFESL